VKILVDLHGFTRTFELDHWQENTTLSDLILAAGGPYIAPDDPLYLDSQPLQGASQLGGREPPRLAPRRCLLIRKEVLTTAACGAVRRPH